MPLVLNKIARAISTIFIPPIFSLAMYIYFPLIFVTGSKSILISIICITFTVIIPILLFVRDRKKNSITDNDILIKEQRDKPFLINLGLYLIGLVLLLSISSPKVIIFLWVSNSLLLLFVIIINKFWKVSIHAAGAAAFFGALYFLFGLKSLFFLILLGLICWSRIKLKCHNIYQVIAGSLLGFSTIYFILRTLQ